MPRVLSALIGAGCLVAVIIAVSQRAEAVTGPATIRITNKETRVVRVDVGRRGLNPGDSEIVTQLLYNRRITPRAIGRSDLVCTFVAGNARSCRATYVLPRGTLVAGGTLRSRRFYQLAVLGGTRLYDNARGTLTVTRIRTRPARDVVYFRLAG